MHSWCVTVTHTDWYNSYSVHDWYVDLFRSLGFTPVSSSFDAYETVNDRLVVQFLIQHSSPSALTLYHLAYQVRADVDVEVVEL